MAYILNHALPTISSVSDHDSANSVLGMATGSAGAEHWKKVASVSKGTLLDAIRYHTMWQDTSTWSGIFFDRLTDRMQKQAAEAQLGEGTSLQEVLTTAGIDPQQVALMEITSVVYDMSLLNIHPQDIQAFLEHMEAFNMVDEANQADLLAMVSDGQPTQLCRATRNRLSGKSSEPLPSYAFAGAESTRDVSRLQTYSYKSRVSTSPRSSGGSAKQGLASNYVSELLGSRAPDFPETFMSMLGAVETQGFLSDVVNTLESCGVQNGVPVHLEPTAFYAFCALLNCCLSISEEQQEYDIVRSIMKATVNVYGPSLTSEEDQALSQRICVHSVWRNPKFWEQAFRLEVREAFSEIEADARAKGMSGDDIMEQKNFAMFKHFSYIVELMLQFCVPPSKVIRFANKQIPIFNEDFQTLVRQAIIPSIEARN
jgi:hypothetical protein